MNFLKIITLFLVFAGCGEQREEPQAATRQTPLPPAEETGKTQILNFGTFHFGYTPDATTTEFDEYDRENQRQAHAVAKKLARFKPTVILVERLPKYNEDLQKEYAAYTADPAMQFENISEVHLLAYELGRLSGTERIYGIDHKMNYNYNIGNELTNDIDSLWHDKYYADPLIFYPAVNVNTDSLDLLDKLKLTNHDRYLDFLIAVNADMLTHAGSAEGFEGADEAAKYYQRNLRMYSNLHRINLTKDDRVFILTGASHTAFFRDFISRSPKYRQVNTLEYLE